MNMGKFVPENFLAPLSFISSSYFLYDKPKRFSDGNGRAIFYRDEIPDPLRNQGALQFSYCVGFVCPDNVFLSSLMRHTKGAISCMDDLPPRQHSRTCVHLHKHCMQHVIFTFSIFITTWMSYPIFQLYWINTALGEECLRWMWRPN